MRRFRHASSPVSVAVLLALVALLTRLAVPVGWMPAEGLRLAPCPAAGPIATMSGAHHHPAGKHGHKGGGGEACPFAAFAGAIDAPMQPPLVTMPVPVTTLPLAIRLAVAIGAGLAAPPPPATGPPATA